MFDAALAAPAKPAPALHPAALAGALLLHLAGLGLLAWAGARPPARLEEPPALEFTLEPPAPETQAPAEAPAEPEAEPPEAPSPEPEPEPEPIEPPPPEPPPPERPEAVAPPPPAPRPRPPQPPRERRPPPAPARTAPAVPPAPVAAAPAAPAGPPIVTNARFRRPPRPPEYPLVAREKGMTGTALLRALVGADGEIREVRLQRSSGHALLDEAALAAVRRWSFEPSSRDGQRIEAWIEIPIRFQLR